jgi:penicillin amidase
VDLRRPRPAAAAAQALPQFDPGALALFRVPIDLRPVGDDDMVRGSNNWAVAGTHTVHGGALLANDMHLGISVPNTWYRLSLVVPGADGERRVTGVTLPGAPFVVAGSNGRVAWGFTNSEGDWADVVLLEPEAGDPEAYLTPEGPRELVRETETVEVKGEQAQTLIVESTIWGPVIAKDPAGRRRALAWVALREGGLNASLVRMESAGGLDEALARTRISSRRTPRGGSVGRSSAASRTGWATTAARPPRGPTGRGDGTAGSLLRSTRGSWTRRAVASGPPTRGS